MFASSRGPIDLDALLKAHRHIELSGEAHQFFDAIAVRAFGNHQGIELAVCFECFANCVDSRQTIHISGARQQSRVAMACAAIASPRPIASTDSLVLAFKLIMEEAMPSDLARVSRMAGKCGPSFGFSVITVASICIMVNLRWANRPRMCSRNSRLRASFHFGSVSGKCVPMSPRPAAPNSASHIA